MCSLPDPAASDQPPGISPPEDWEREYPIDALLARLDGVYPPPPPAESNSSPVTPEEFRQLWDRAHTMAAFGLSAMWELQAAADGLAPDNDVGILVDAACDYLDSAQLPPWPANLDPADAAVRARRPPVTPRRGRDRFYPTPADYVQELLEKVIAPAAKDSTLLRAIHDTTIAHALVISLPQVYRENHRAGFGMREIHNGCITDSFLEVLRHADMVQ